MEAQLPPQAAAPPLSSPVPPPHLNYPESVDSSPRSRNTDSWDEPFPPAAASTKLRLMCSYGGHIVPRPHDKSLCYVGGDTRIIVVDCNTSLSDLSSRLSKTFLDGRPFTLKYQLPSEDLDSLISVTTDEDLDNMIDEYDRTAANSSNPSVKPSRIRLFLFPTKPESSQSIGPILDSSAKSDDWFLNALNNAGMLNRGFSESASVNCLLGLDDEVGGNNLDPGSRDVEAAQPGSFANSKNVKQGQDFHSVPDSPMLETTSSFGSTSSSPSLANLPPIRVHVDDGSGGAGARVYDQKAVGIEEQFAQMGVGGGQKQDEGFAVMSSPPPMPATIGVPVSSAAVAGEYQNRVISDDERSDHGVPVGYRRPPTPQPQTQTQPQPQTLPPQFQQKSTGGIDLSSPDSVSSDSSLSNAMSRPKPVIYQDQVQIPSGATRVHGNPIDPKLNMSDPRIQMQQQLQDPGYLLQQQFDQQLQQPQQQQGYALQQQFDQQQQQPQQQQGYALQQQFDQQQQQPQQQQGYALQQQFDQQQQQPQQQQGYALQQQFDQQQQQPQQQQGYALQQQFDQQQQQGYVLQQQFDQQQQQPQQQQQFIQGTHFIHHTPSGPVPIPAYYPVYPSQQQPHPQHHPQLDQQYPVYYVPARQAQAYNLSVQQPNISEPATTIPSSRPQTPPNPAMVPPSAAYNPIRNAPLPKSEMTVGGYRTATAGAPQLVQVPSSQHQQQYVAYSQIHHPSQSVAPRSAAPASYACDYADPAHAQIYYTQPTKP